MVFITVFIDCADFLVAAFARYEQHQDNTFSDIFTTIIPNLQVKSPAKSSKTAKHLQTVSSLLLRITQVGIDCTEFDCFFVFLSTYVDK